MTNFKLGLFVLLAAGALVALAFALGIRGGPRDVVIFHTYFDESVQGLELGAPVKYRGVDVGTVSEIRVAPDRRLVEVGMEIEAERARALALAQVPANLRAHLGTQGITGVKLIDLDFVGPRVPAAPALSFEPAPRTIPSAPSLLKSLGDNLADVLAHIGPMVDELTRTVHRVELTLVDVDDQRIPERAARLLDAASLAVRDVRRVANALDRAEVPRRTSDALQALERSLAKADDVLGRLGGERGLVAGAQRALADVDGSTGRELERALRDVGEAARSVRDLAQSIERQPDMLLKGRAP